MTLQPLAGASDRQHFRVRACVVAKIYLVAGLANDTAIVDDHAPNRVLSRRIRSFTRKSQSVLHPVSIVIRHMPELQEPAAGLANGGRQNAALQPKLHQVETCIRPTTHAIRSLSSTLANSARWAAKQVKR